MSGPEKLKALDNTGLHTTADGKLQDSVGLLKKADGPCGAIEFTNKELIKLRERCSAWCAENGKEDVDDEVFEDLEMFVSAPSRVRKTLRVGADSMQQIPNHSAATMKKKWAEIRGMPRPFG